MHAKNALLGLGALLVVSAALGAAFFDRIVLRTLSPGVPFDATAAPRAPDYADPAAWTALPGRADAADALPPALPATDQSTALADLFYVHPTTYRGCTAWICMDSKW